MPEDIFQHQAWIDDDRELRTLVDGRLKGHLARHRVVFHNEDSFHFDTRLFVGIPGAEGRLGGKWEHATDAFLTFDVEFFPKPEGVA